MAADISLIFIPASVALGLSITNALFTKYKDRSKLLSAGQSGAKKKIPPAQYRHTPENACVVVKREVTRDRATARAHLRFHLLL